MAISQLPLPTFLYHILLTIWIFVVKYYYTDCIMGGNPISIGERISNHSNDGVLDNISVPISTKDLSLSLPLASHAKPLWLHFWNRLVGNCSQHDCIFCRIPRKFIICLYFSDLIKIFIHFLLLVTIILNHLIKSY